MQKAERRPFRVDRPAVWGNLYGRWRLQSDAPVAVFPQEPALRLPKGTPSSACQGRSGATSLLEKRGLGLALAQAGVTPRTPLGFADEMRVGLRGMVRRVWGRRGVKVRQRLQLVYEWRYLFLVVDGRKGTLHWTWMESMKAEMVGAAVRFGRFAIPHLLSPRGCGLL
jgi:hypothetical protein